MLITAFVVCAFETSVQAAYVCFSKESAQNRTARFLIAVVFLVATCGIYGAL